MTKKREPIDVVGRLASRLSLSSGDRMAMEPPAPPSPLAMRATAPRAVEPRVVGRPVPPRAEPTLRRAANVPPATIREVPVAPRPVVAEPAPVVQAEPPRETLATPPAVEQDLRDSAATLPVAAAQGDRNGEVGLLEAPRKDQAAVAETDAVDRDNGVPGRKCVQLNLVRLHKDGFLTPQNQRSLIAEEYRIIKRPLLRTAFDHTNDPRNLNHVVMITSACPDEGKTFTAINLAMSVATERDLFVLLVDCDIRRMGLSKKLGVADRKGLMDVLVNPSLPVADVMLRTNVPNLAVIPSGQPVEAATEVFASAKMTTLVDDISSRYPDRFIIFDAPPVLASSEPGVLAVHVGQTVMVVHANQTSKRAIAQSIPLINGCPNVHFVLNRVTRATGTDRFGYYGTY